MKKILLSFILYALFYSAIGKPTDEDNYPIDDQFQNDDNDEGLYDDLNQKDDLEENDDSLATEDPESYTILTPNMTFYQYEGEKVTLPCKIDAKGGPVRMWYKESVLYFQSELKLQAPSNVRLTKDNSLEITNFTKENEGVYRCALMIDQNNQPTIYHTVHYRSDAPKIEVLEAKDNITTLKVDDTLSLRCIASGRPKPEISWHKGMKNTERLGTKGEHLIITNVKQRDAGVYRCLADNGKAPAYAIIEIKVEHKPIVTLEKIMVNSNTESDTEFKCIVHAEPRAQVNWQKDGHNIYTGGNIELKKQPPHNHLLILKNVQENDFGEYTCSATNALGTTMKHVKLVKTPALLKFHKPQLVGKDLVLTWELQSKSPITQHEIQYRKKGGDGTWKLIEPQVSGNAMDDGIYVVKHTIKGVEPGMYETRIRSQNKHGWSELFDASFEGAPHGHKHKHKNHQKDNTRTASDALDEQHMGETRVPAGEKPVTQSKLNKVEETKPENDEVHKDDARTAAASSERTNAASSTTSSMLLLSIAVFLLCLRQ